ncbi:MAG: PH domain-containing protein [Salibacteraceae bacterium]
MSENETVFKATFNPKIKTYFFIIGCLFGLIPFIGWLFLVVWVLGLGKFFINRYYNSLSCELLPRVLHFRKGVMFQVEKSIPLENIQDLTFKQGPLMRWLGLSVFQIETAGGQGPGPGGDLTLIGIVNPKEFRQTVLDQREKISSSSNKSPSEDSESAVLKEISETLKRIESKLDK